MIRVAVVDDHPVVSGGLESGLARHDDIEVTWTAASVQDARARLSDPAQPVDVVLLDVRLPDGSGLDLLPGATADRPAFVVISSFDRPLYAVNAFRRGAAGFLLKVAPIDTIAEVIRRVSLGELAFEARHLAPARDRPVFTARELQLIKLVAASMSNDEIGTQMGISSKTVEHYLREIFRRHGFVARTELALWAEREGWLDGL